MYRSFPQARALPLCLSLLCNHEQRAWKTKSKVLSVHYLMVEVNKHERSLGLDKSTVKSNNTFYLLYSLVTLQ